MPGIGNTLRHAKIRKFRIIEVIWYLIKLERYGLEIYPD